MLTGDPLNGDFAGWQRDCRQSFWSETACVLEPVTPGARVLAEGIDYGGKPLGPLMGAFENRLGGRIVACGYYPWHSLQTLAKTSQLKAICRWLSNDRLPAYLASYHKVPLWVRRDADGHPALFLLNALARSGGTGGTRSSRRRDTLTLIRTDGSTAPWHPHAVTVPTPSFPWSAWTVGDGVGAYLIAVNGVANNDSDFCKRH